ncbi:MAG TPA: type II secretion system protein [Burkholderiaceae bacterium]
MKSRGFTLIELVAVILIVAVLTAVALPRFLNLGTSSRIAAVNSLAGTVNTSLGLVHTVVYAQGAGTPSGIPGVTFVSMDGKAIRVWNSYPDRWCDGIGAMLANAVVPSGGCYLSTAAVPSTTFTFYGYSNATIPNGDAGWRIETAPTPAQCAVGYRYNGSGQPSVITYTSGC